MKTKLHLIFSLILLSLSPVPYALSQIPQSFNYQAIVRNTSGEVLQNKSLKVTVAVTTALTGGIVLWEEYHDVISNQSGLVSFAVGSGTFVSGTATSFDRIDWKAQPLYLKTTIEYPVGTVTDMGTTQILSVPYSLVAKDVQGPIGKLDIKATEASLDSALFEVKNKNGQTIFAVYSEGVRIYVDNGAKGAKGGFAVGGFDMAKGTKQTFLAISDDSVKIYIDSNPLTKKPKGGFAVGGYDMAKGTVQNYIDVSADSIRMYIDKNAKSKKGGFAVGSFDMSKGGTDHFLDVATDASGIINPAQNRILWYPLKNAFLTGKVRIGTPDSVGVNSFATGYESKARGMYSQAMGFKAIANGDYSTAIGKKAVAAGTGSFAFGDEVISNGTNSYSFGQQTIALGKGSFALGTTLAGTKTMAQKDNSFALGLGCNANGIGAISIGTGNLSIADYSFTAGKDATASNTSATAIGQSVIASGIYSTAFGYSTTASGNYSTAFGNSTVASGDYSTSLGFSTSAVGASSIAMGRGSSASGSYNTVIGYDSHTNYNRDNSTAIGFQCYTLSGESFAAGSGTTAGNSGLLYGMAYAIGYKVNATGGSSLCLGIESTASGFGSRAIGDNATASGKYSTSIGLYNSTIGEYSTALGEHTQANTRSEFVVGSGNILSSGSATTWVPTEPLFIVGNSPNTAARSNALTILKNGMVGIGTNTPVYKLHTIGDIYADGGWLRVSGGAGLYFESWGGGWNMSDATWIRAMNNKSVYCTGTIRTDGTLQVGDGTTLNVPNGGNFTYSTNVLFANTSGNVGIGTNAPSYALTVSRSASGSFAASISNSAGTEISHGLRIFAGSSTIAGANFIAFYRPNVTSLKIGSITQNAASSVAYNTSSDLRLKEGIRKTGYTIDDLMKIKVVDFNFIFDESKTNLTGFIAQDMNEIYPSAVTIPVDENDYWSIDYGKVTPLIVKAVQDQQEIIESLSQKNQRLETELKSLKEEINQIKTMLAKGVTE